MLRLNVSSSQGERRNPTKTQLRSKPWREQRGRSRGSERASWWSLLETVHKLSQAVQNTNTRSTSIENLAFEEIDSSEIPSSVYHKTMVKEQRTSHMFTSQGLSIALPDWPLHFTASDWRKLAWVGNVWCWAYTIRVGETLLLSRLSMIFQRL